MHRKLNIQICIAAILLIFSVAGVENNDPGDSFSADNVESSAQNCKKVAKSEQLQKSLSVKFRPGAFFSKFTKKSAVKEYAQKSKVIIQKSLKNKRSRTALVVLSVFTACVLIFIRYYKKLRKVNRFMTTTRLSVMNSFVRQACRYIENNYADPDLTVDQICSDLITGKAYLEAIFKKELGMRVEDFIDQVRINRVKIMINKNPDLSLSEAAKATGFSVEKECLTKFQNICGVDFEAYRDKIYQSSGF